MIRKSVQRFSEKIMLNQRAKARWRFNQIPSRFSPRRMRGISPRVQARKMIPRGGRPLTRIASSMRYGLSHKGRGGTESADRLDQAKSERPHYAAAARPRGFSTYS